MEAKEKQALKRLRIFEREFIKYDPLNIVGQFQIYYNLKKRAGKDDFSTLVTFSIKDIQLWERYLNEPRKIRSMLKNYCAYFCFDFKIVKPLVFIRGDENVFAVPGKDLEQRVNFEYFSHILNPNFYEFL